MSNFAAVYVILIATVVFVACTAATALAMQAFAKALTAVHAARLHAAQAQATEQTLESTDRALRGAPAPPSTNGYRRPTKEELMEGIHLQRELHEQGDEMGDTDENAGLEEDLSSVGGSGAMYAEDNYGR